MIKLFKTLIFCLIIINCKERVKTENNYSFLEKYEALKLPFTDSTNFDNHKIQELITPNQLKLLKLDQVFSKEHLNFENSKVGINYILDLSEKYNTIAFFFYFAEMELSSTLVNYDSDFNIIDYKTVAMDEIAESIFRTESLIDKNKIVVTNFRYFNKTIEEKEQLEITRDGKFIIK